MTQVLEDVGELRVDVVRYRALDGLSVADREGKVALIANFGTHAKMLRQLRMMGDDMAANFVESLPPEDSILYIRNLDVHPGERHHGHGGRALDMAIDEARRQGVRHAFLFPVPESPDYEGPLVALYEKHGFVREVESDDPMHQPDLFYRRIEPEGASEASRSTASGSLPFVLVRVGDDVVPVVLGQDEHNQLAGWDIVRERVVPVASGDVVAAVSTNPAAVYFGVDLVENERQERMAAETDHSCFPCGLQDAQEDRGPRISVEELSATFLANVEGDGSPYEFKNDPRTETMARTLESIGVKGVRKILGAGTFGTAALLDDDTVIKLTSDPTEVQAGAVLRGKKLTHVARIEKSFFIRGVRAKTHIGTTPLGKKITRAYPAGVLFTEKVTPIPEDHAADQLSQTVNTVKVKTRTYPDQLARLKPAEQRVRLRRASADLESILRFQADYLDENGRDEEAALARGVADGLHELRENGVYAIDVHEGNIGYVEKSGRKTFKIFDIGSSSPPAKPAAQVLDDNAKPDAEQLELPGVLEDVSAAEWVGDGVDPMEHPDRRVGDSLQSPSVELADWSPSDLARGAKMRVAGPDGRWHTAEEARKPIDQIGPQGHKFAPVTLPLLGDLPVVTGYTQVRAQLEKHRAKVPSAETITLSVVFSGLSIMTGIDQAEAAFDCVTKLYEQLGRKRLPTLAEIQSCIIPLGLIKQRSAMYETAAAWSPAVRDAMKRGLRDRELRRFLYLESELPVGIGLAKLSFVLSLCGNDTVCLDARLLGRMYGADGRKVSSSLNTQPARVSTLEKYETIEDLFLDGNPFYDPKDPIGRARAQWQSWEQAGKPPKPATHSVWLNVVR